MKKKRAFFRSFILSLVVVFGLIFGTLGAFTVYESTRAIGFGEYKKAVEYSDGRLRIFDFEFVLPGIM